MDKGYIAIRYLLFVLVAGSLGIVLLLMPPDTAVLVFLTICIVSFVVVTGGLLAERRTSIATKFAVYKSAYRTTTSKISLALFAPLERNVKPVALSLIHIVGSILRAPFSFIQAIDRTVWHPLRQGIAQKTTLFIHPFERPIGWFKNVILLNRRNRNFALSVIMLLVANYLLFSPDILLISQIDTFAQFFQVSLFNNNNLVFATILLLISAYCAVRALNPAPVRDLPDHTRPIYPSLFQLVRYNVIPLFILAVLYIILIMRLSQADGAADIIILWSLCLLLLAWAGFRYDRKAGVSLSLHIERRDLIILGAIGVAGLLVAIYQFDTLPNTLAPDEGPFLIEAVTIAQGQETHSFFDSGPFTFPLPGSFYQAAAFKLLGESLWTWRLSSLAIALLGVIPTYLLARELFNRRLAALAGIVMVTMPHFLTYARAGYNNSQAILPVALAMYCLYIALEQNSVFYIIVSAISAGLGFYTYSAGRLGSIVGLIYFLILVAVGIRVAISRQPNKKVRLRAIGNRLFLGAIFCGGVAITVLPLITFQNTVNPGALRYKVFENFFGNAEYVQPMMPQENLYRDYPPIVMDSITIFVRADVYGFLLVHGIVNTMLGFIIRLVPFNLWFIGSALPGSVGALFCVIGLALVIAKVRKKEYALLFLWFASGVFFLSILNIDPPRETHLVVIIPAEAIFVALALDACVRFLREKWLSSWKIATITMTGALLASVLLTGVYDYYSNLSVYYPPDIYNIIDFYNMQLSVPRNVYFVTTSQPKYELPLVMTSNLAHNAFYQPVKLDELAVKVRPPADQGFTCFVEPDETQKVMEYLTGTLHRDNIQTRKYADVYNKIILVSYEVN